MLTAPTDYLSGIFLYVIIVLYVVSCTQIYKPSWES